MNRATYLQKIKDGISIFEEGYQQQKILELDDQISKAIRDGKSEEEALSLLGDADQVINQIYTENHVNRKKTMQESNFLISKYNQLFKVINHVVDVMSHNTAKANAKILFDILVLIVLTCVIKIPFIMVRDLGVNLLDFFANPFINNLWELFIEIIYLIVGITFFLNVFKKWFQNLKINQK